MTPYVNQFYWFPIPLFIQILFIWSSPLLSLWDEVLAWTGG